MYSHLGTVILVGIVPIAFPVAIICSIFELFGKVFDDHEVGVIELISTIFSIILAIVVLVLLLYIRF